MIYLLRIHVKSLEKRLRRFDASMNAKRKLELLRNSQKDINGMDGERAGLQSISYNIYSKIAEFLTAKDLAAMELVN